MLADALSVSPANRVGRFVVGTVFRGDLWEIIVEPDEDEMRLVVVTAYAVD